MLGPALDRLGLDNVVLVDPVSLEVIFSYDQSTIFGTALDSGPYSGSGVAMLARALRRSQDEDDYKFADFESFRPALGQPRAFIASPVFVGPDLVSIMILRFPIEPIAQALSNNGGLGGRGARQDRAGLSRWSRHDHACRFPLPGRGQGELPRDASATPG